MNPSDPVGQRPPCSSAPNSRQIPPDGSPSSAWPYFNVASPRPAPPVAGQPPPPTPAQSFWTPYAAPTAVPYAATPADGFLAIALLALGFLFFRWCAFTAFEGWGVAVVACLWVCLVLLYARGKGLAMCRGEALFWLGVTLLAALSCALWPGASWHPLRGALLLFAALYGVAVLFGILAAGRTGNLFFFDGVNLLFALPFQNLGYTFKGIAALGGKKERRSAARKLLPVVAGLILAAIVLAMVLPGLARADSGNFGRLVEDFTGWLRQIDLFNSEEAAKIFAQIVLGIPLAVWLCALVAGAAHRRRAESITAKGAEAALPALRFLPGATVMVVFAAASALYAMFIGCQIPYFFSALGGSVPAGHEIYSEYAREGFFELCRIAAINLGLLALGNGLYRGQLRKSPLLRALNILLAAFTLLILLTAFSKMGLYISVYGLTPMRVLTCVFMAFLAGVCAAVILLQFRRFSIVRFALLLGSGMLCALCLVNTGGLIVDYNAQRYLAGTLAEFDEEVLWRCGPSGAPAAFEVYGNYDGALDEEARMRLYYVLHEQQSDARSRRGTAADNLPAAQVRDLDLSGAGYDLNECRELFYDRMYGNDH